MYIIVAFVNLKARDMVYIIVAFVNLKARDVKCISLLLLLI